MVRVKDVKPHRCDEVLWKIVEPLRSAKSPVVGEVGSWQGRTALLMAEWIFGPGGVFYAVDHFRGSEGDDQALRAAAGNRLLHGYFERTRHQSNLHTLVMGSLEAANIFKDNMFDFFYIDGDHLYKSIKADIEAWYPKVKPGGVLGGHDCGCHANDVDPAILMIEDRPRHEETTLFPGVIRAVCERFDKEQLHIEKGIWWIRK